MDAAELRRFRTGIRRWYGANARKLPWRTTRDPYKVLVSELMLQQTQVARVVGFYHAFLQRFPTLYHVARAPVGRVLERWEGLGYYARARNLHRLARLVAPGRAGHNALPVTAAALQALPGIGAYTAGAVSSFAYEQRSALVDTNVARVLLRVFAPAFSPKSAQGNKVAWAIAQRALPRTGKHTWTHNQALMELGALVCRAQVRECQRCPVASVCQSVQWPESAVADFRS